MSTSQRPGRSGLARRLAWLIVAGLAAMAIAAPSASTVLAADAVVPVENDVACNNVESGSDSPLVSIATSADGLIVNWSQAEPPAGFGVDGTMVIRACVDGEGAWSQNDTNDGTELFPWALFGLTESPCPGDAVLGGSVDGGTPFVNTQKQNGISCTTTSTPTPTPVVTPTPTPVVTPTPTPVVTPTPTPVVTPTPTPVVTPTPTPVVTPTPTPVVTPTPTPVVTRTPTPVVTPTPTPAPTTEVTVAPTGGVGGATGTPAAATAGTTLPPTSTIGGSDGSGGDGWRALLLALAGLLAAGLLLTPAAVVRKDRRS